MKTKLLFVLVIAISYSQLRLMNEKINRLESDKLSREEYFQMLMNYVSKPIMPYMGQCSINDYIRKTNYD